MLDYRASCPKHTKLYTEQPLSDGQYSYNFRQLGSRDDCYGEGPMYCTYVRVLFKKFLLPHTYVRTYMYASVKGFV